MEIKHHKLKNQRTTQRMRIRNILALLVATCLFTACSDDAIFDDMYSFDDRSWGQTELVKFDVDIQNTNDAYSLILTLRHSTSYAYNNFWIYLYVTTPDGKTSKTPYEINIANEDGSWIGTKSGTIVESKLIFKTEAFKDAGIYSYTIEQGINKKEMPEILDIGLRVEPFK